MPWNVLSEMKESALQKALELIPKNSSISWGGSETIIETSLLNAIKNNDVISDDLKNFFINFSISTSIFLS